MTGLLLDTHIWLWYLAGSDRLPAAARDQIDAAPERCWLSPISIWEAGLLARQGRIALASPFATWAERALQAFPVREAPLNRAVAAAALEVALAHQDPADHFLAATALTYGLTLVTVDSRLTTAEWLPTLP